MDRRIAHYYENLYRNPDASPVPLRDDPPHLSTHMRNPFTTEDIEEALRHTNGKKGLGPDLFDIEILDKDSVLRDRFKTECADALNNGRLPLHLSNGRLITLSKEHNRNVTAVENTRPIVIRSHISKVVEKALKFKIDKEHKHLLETASSQAGFKQGLTT